MATSQTVFHGKAVNPFENASLSRLVPKIGHADSPHFCKNKAIPFQVKDAHSPENTPANDEQQR